MAQIITIPEISEGLTAKEYVHLSLIGGIGLDFLSTYYGITAVEINNALSDILDSGNEASFSMLFKNSNAMQMIFANATLSAKFWEVGFSAGSGSQSINAGYLTLNTTGTTSTDDKRSYVSKFPINITDIDKVKVDWYQNGYTYPSSILSIGTVKTADANLDTTKYVFGAPFARRCNEIDVSAISGSFYIKVMGADLSSADRRSLLNVYRAWGK